MASVASNSECCLADRGFRALQHYRSHGCLQSSYRRIKAWLTRFGTLGGGDPLLQGTFEIDA